MNRSLVSVIIPCHNAAKYVGAAIKSVLTQSWKNLEIIVVNDGSTDGVEHILAEFAQRGVIVIQPDPPLKSAARSRNLGLSRSRGDYVRFFDADDILHPQVIERQIECLGRNGCEEDVSFSGWGRFYNDTLTTFKLDAFQANWRDMDAREWLIESWMNGRPMMQPGMFLIPRSLIKKSGGWDEDLSLIDDFEFFARVLSLAKNLRFAADVPLKYRSGLVSSLSGQKGSLAIESAFRSLLSGTSHLLASTKDPRARMASANMLQDFIYTFYPKQPQLLRLAAQRVRELGGSSLPPTGSPTFERWHQIIGWRLARRLQLLVR